MVYCNTFLKKKSLNVFQSLREFIFQNDRSTNSKRAMYHQEFLLRREGNDGRNNNMFYITIDA